MAEAVWNLSRPPTEKERARLETRLRRLEAPGFDAHLAGIATKLATFRRPAGKLDDLGLRIRQPFSCRSTPIPGDASDRKAPPRELRPPATRIGSSLGSALRLELTTLALLQLHRRPGAAAHLADLGLTIAGASQEIGWADLVAVNPSDSNRGGHFVNVRDKRARTVRKALDGLEQAGLVDVPGKPGELNRYEGFVLLDEAGVDHLGERREYTVPKIDPHVFALPTGLVHNGWLHLLEDSEIAVLLMVACRTHSWIDDGLWVFSGFVRLRHYGIHRDPYAMARKTLEWFGLLNVREVGRHEDGRAEDDDRLVHRIGLLPSGFTKPALPTIQTEIRRQLARR